MTERAAKPKTSWFDVKTTQGYWGTSVAPMLSGDYQQDEGYFSEFNTLLKHKNTSGV